MELAALIVAVVALLLALVSLARAGAARTAAEDADATARRQASGVEGAVRSEVAELRTLLSRLVGGSKLTPEMVEEGLLWRDVDSNEAQALLEAGEVALLDVRTPEETSAGVIPGAQLVPMDQVEGRRSELPTDKPLLVYCAGGGRSASVCEFLSQEGHVDVLNLAGGIGDWRGPVERPS